MKLAVGAWLCPTAPAPETPQSPNSPPHQVPEPVRVVQEALLEDLLVEYAQTMASAILAALPLLIVFMLFQRQIVKGFATSGLGGQ